MNSLVRLWNHPSSAENYTEKQWENIVKQARASHLLAILGYKIIDEQAVKVNPRIWHHFSSAMLVAEQHRYKTDIELKKLDAILQEINLDAFVLKGAAYHIKDLDLAKGRTFSDIDLLFQKDHINTIENKLWFSGYLPAQEDDYDKRYYREWMHEIPPLQHIKSKVVLDIHHNILPVTGKTTVDLHALLANPSKVSGLHAIKTFSDEAMILHSATHLFHEGEFEKGLRDLMDLASLLSDYIKKYQSLDSLIRVAKETNLGVPLFLATRYVEHIFELSILENDKTAIAQFFPSKLKLRILDFCFLNVFTPYHSSFHSKQKILAEFILLSRSHLLKMPLRLLIPHLLKKSFKSVKEKFSDKEKSTPTT